MTLPAIDMIPAMQPKVYVVQMPMKLSQETKQLIPSLDLSPAEKFGTLVYCLDWPEIKHMNVQAMYKKLAKTLAEYTDNDYILLAGNPVAGVIVAMACQEHSESGTLRLLNWARVPGEYQAVSVSMDEYLGVCDEL